MSELQTALAGAVGHRLHAAMVLVASAIEDDARDPGLFGPLRDPLTDGRRLLGLLPLANAGAGDREERPPLRVVHELGGDVLQRTEHHEARTLGGAGQRVPHAQVTPLALL